MGNSPSQQRLTDLLAAFVGSFGKLDDLDYFPEIDPIAAALTTGEPDEYGMFRWQPRRSETDASSLEMLYAKLPARFPPLFERLLLTYRWAEVDLETFKLLPNPPGPDLKEFLGEMTRDKGLWDALIPAGFLQFGRGPDIDYDPVCFDISSRKKNRDMRIVKIDHEEILCNYKVKVVAQLAPSFFELLQDTITLAASKP
jgi:hypothetical protein